MPTPHISAQKGDFAPVTLMPGDPLRARYIAHNFLDEARLVTEIRAMEGYTGTYKGVPVSVQGSGMGIPSIQIYATELITEFDVKNIVRVGSCGAVRKDVALQDIVVAVGAGTDSATNRFRLSGRDFAATADWNLLSAVMSTAASSKTKVRAGNVFSSDFFYDPNSEIFEMLERYGFLAVEMEAAGLYGVAAEHGAAALAICTVSDQLKTKEALSAQDRQTSFDEMITLVLEACSNL